MRALNRQTFAALNMTCVVVDDDPTGNQTVHGVPVLADWSIASLIDEFSKGTPVFYILANSRSLTAEETRGLMEEIGVNIKKAAITAGRRFLVVSRSDSTLRGHYPLEVDTLAKTLDFDGFITFLIPVMFEGGRVTENDIHYLTENGRLIPVNETPFAQDKVFGYRNADLKLWIEEKTEGRVSASDVKSITLDDIRSGGLAVLKAKLQALSADDVCIVNATNYTDLDLATQAILTFLQKSTAHVIFRTSSSFVPSFVGLPQKDLLSKGELALNPSQGGLIIVGSYVPKSSSQLSFLLANHRESTQMELAVEELLELEDNTVYLRKVANDIDQSIRQNKDVVLYTSRKLITAEDNSGNLSIGTKISNAIITIVSLLQERPSYIIAKGGITSNDVAVHGLQMKRCVVRVQCVPGVPVWEMGEETKFPGLTYVVFPGNVGHEASLMEVTQKLN